MPGSPFTIYNLSNSDVTAQIKEIYRFLNNLVIGEPVISLSGANLTPAPASGNIYKSVTGNSIDGGVSEEVLKTYPLPAFSLDKGGVRLHIQAWGTTNGTALAKTIKLYFGSYSVTVLNAVALTNTHWYVDMWIVRKTSTFESAVTKMYYSNAMQNVTVDTETVTQDLAVSNVIKLTGQSLATLGITCNQFTIDLHNAVS